MDTTKSKKLRRLITFVIANAVEHGARAEGVKGLDAMGLLGVMLAAQKPRPLRPDEWKFDAATVARLMDELEAHFAACTNAPIALAFPLPAMEDAADRIIAEIMMLVREDADIVDSFLSSLESEGT